MSQKLLVFLVGLLLLSALGSYLYYRHAVASVPVDPWALVPDDAVLVAATRDHATLVRHLQETQLWDNLTAVRYIQRLEDNIALIDSLASTRNTVLRFLGTKQVLTSVHVTDSGSFDLLFQVPVRTVREYRQVRIILDALSRDSRYEVHNRTYQGQPLTEVQNSTGGHLLTVCNYRNHLLFSTNATLIEAVVRRLEHPGLPTVATDFQNTDYLQLKDVDATLLVNYRRLPQFLALFFRPELAPEITSVTSLARNGQLEMQVAGNKVLFNGFANPETTHDALHQQLQGQPAQRLRMADVLSLRTALLVHIGLGPATALRGARPAPTDSVARRSAVLIDSLAATLTTEVGLCYLAAPSARQKLPRLALAYCANPGQAAILLGQLRRASGASPSFERVGPYQLYQAGIPELPRWLLGPLFAGFETPFVAQVGNYLALGEDAAALRLWLTDVAAGSVWSRSPTQVAFLQEGQPLARLSIFMDMRNSWHGLLRGLQEEQRAGLLRNEALFKRFPQIGLQFVPAANENEAGAQYFTQLILRHPAVGSAEARAQNQSGTGSALTFKLPLTSAPALLPVPGVRFPGVLVQDAANVLHYVTPDNVAARSDTLAGPLVGPVRRLTSGNQSRLLFATANQLHLLDERGREAPNFPLNMPDTVQVTSLTPAPVATGTTVRLLVAGGGSNLFLYDTNGRTFPGWLPKSLDFTLAAAPSFLVVADRDVLVAPLENGYVYAFDQQGSMYPGFPISVGARLQSGAFVETGPTLRRTRLTVVTQHGERVTFNLSGDVVSRSRVATWSRTSTFRIIPNQNQSSYVVAREEGGRLTLFEPTGKQVLTQSFVTSGTKPVQYFDFGNDRRIFVVTEPGPRKAYLYNSQGHLLGKEPFASSAPGVGLNYDANTNTYRLYRTLDHELLRTDLSAVN